MQRWELFKRWPASRERVLTFIFLLYLPYTIVAEAELLRVRCLAARRISPYFDVEHYCVSNFDLCFFFFSSVEGASVVFCVVFRDLFQLL